MGFVTCRLPRARRVTPRRVTPLPPASPALGMRWGEKGFGDPRHSNPGG